MPHKFHLYLIKILLFRYSWQQRRQGSKLSEVLISALWNLFIQKRQWWQSFYVEIGTSGFFFPCTRLESLSLSPKIFLVMSYYCSWNRWLLQPPKKICYTFSFYVLFRIYVFTPQMLPFNLTSKFLPPKLFYQLDTFLVWKQACISFFHVRP